MSLVNGYRVKCQNYKRMADREAETRRREERLGQWSMEKASRKAAVRQLKTKLRRPGSGGGGSGLAGSASSGSGWTELIAEDQLAQESEEVNRRSFQDDQDSLQDLRMTKKSEKSACCSCSIM